VPLPKPFQGVFYDYEIVTHTNVVSHADGDPVTQDTLVPPDGKVIVSVNAYYYDVGTAPTELESARRNESVPLQIASDGTSVLVASADSAAAQFPTSAVVQLVCARINN
jgi:hypothetical protein